MRNLKDRGGNVLVLFAAAGSALAIMSVGVWDYTRIQSAHAGLQAAVDAAALDGARAVREDRRTADVLSRVRGAFEANVARLAYGASATVDPERIGDEIHVSASLTVPTLILGVIREDDYILSAKAAAVADEGPPVCLLHLGSGLRQEIQDTSTLDAVGCAVHSNGTQDPGALYIDAGARARAFLFCSVGSAQGATSSFSPLPTDHCPPVARPDYSTPSIVPASGCTNLDVSVPEGETRAFPAGSVYCGNFNVAGRVIFESGVHYFDTSGPLYFSGESQAEGSEVTLLLMNKDVRFEVNGESALSLSAPTSGTLAGIVIAQPPGETTGAPLSRFFDHATVELVGAVFLPRHKWRVFENARLGVESQYIALVVSEFDMMDEANVRLEADHKAVGFPDVLPRPYYIPRLLPALTRRRRVLTPASRRPHGSRKRDVGRAAQRHHLR